MSKVRVRTVREQSGLELRSDQDPYQAGLTIRKRADPGLWKFAK